MKDINAQHCGRVPDPKDSYLDDLDLRLEEQITLTIARMFFQSFCTPEGMTWIAALAEAEARFGTEEGPKIAARLLASLQSVRRARRSTFMFNSPTCPGCAAIATEHERRFITAVAALRRGDTGKARLEVMMLCEGNRVEIVVTALQALARALDGDSYASCQSAKAESWSPS